LQEVFPAAEVETQGNNSSSVNIYAVTADQKAHATKVVSVAQRDLYRKYKWPAAPKIHEHLAVFKETMEE